MRVRSLARGAMGMAVMTMIGVMVCVVLVVHDLTFCPIVREPSDGRAHSARYTDCTTVLWSDLASSLKPYRRTAG